MSRSDATVPSPASLVQVDAAHAGQRLDNYLLATLKGVPRSHVYRLVRSGQVRVNRGRARPDRRLIAGDLVRIPPMVLRPAAAEPDPDRFQWLKERVLYRDPHLIVLDKPAGLAVHGGTGVRTGLIEALRAVHPDDGMLELVHRLDRDTSGCLLIARDRKTLVALHAMLRTGKGIGKHYLALVRGPWHGGAREVHAALSRGAVRGGERLATVDAEGRRATSRFRVAKRFADATLVEIELATGRTHQARVHAAHIGHPIAGDERYGDAVFNKQMKARGLGRLFLHAARLEFEHPADGQRRCVRAPLPPQEQAVLDKLMPAETG